MKKFLQRIAQSIAGKGYGGRLVRIAKILNREWNEPQISDEITEEIFIDFITSTNQGCTLDWRGGWPDIKNSILNFATDDEVAVIRQVSEPLTGRISGDVAKLSHAMKAANLSRHPILLESLGDFVHLLFVPISALPAIEDAAGGWLINCGN